MTRNKAQELSLTPSMELTPMSKASTSKHSQHTTCLEANSRTFPTLETLKWRRNSAVTPQPAATPIRVKPTPKSSIPNKAQLTWLLVSKVVGNTGHPLTSNGHPPTKVSRRGKAGYQWRESRGGGLTFEISIPLQSRS